ncbi:DUF6230 family protein [Amycolatopsis pigmentata]|uniref:DUF6230 family protein n=1 Tax=Amycolatopsis pigmentata TaxID=450801 RepID=A0ABW5G581_9PSEU
MADAPERPVGRIRWRRFLAVFTAGFFGAVGLMVAVAQDALAVSFAVAGVPLKISADLLRGNGFVAFGTIDREVDGTLHPVVVNAFRHAHLDEFCQSVVMPAPFIGPVTLRITSPDVSAEDLVTDAQVIRGDITYKDIETNIDASTVTEGPRGVRGARGASGTQADEVIVKNLRQVAWASTAETLHLERSTTVVLPGRHDCFDDQ